MGGEMAVSGAGVTIIVSTLSSSHHHHHYYYYYYYYYYSSSSSSPSIIEVNIGHLRVGEGDTSEWHIELMATSFMRHGMELLVVGGGGGIRMITLEKHCMLPLLHHNY